MGKSAKSSCVSWKHVIEYLGFRTGADLLPGAFPGRRAGGMRPPEVQNQFQEEKIMSLFSSDKHKKIFDKQINLYKKQGYILSNRFIAALFILTADSFIWNRSKYHIKPNIILFDEIDIKGIEPDSYLLFKMAKDFINKTNNVSTSELADKLITREPLFQVIINGIIIARYGIDIVELKMIPKGDKY